MLWGSAVGADPDPVTGPTSSTATAIEGARQRLSVADGLQVEAWATEPLVRDITSIDFDGEGRAYVVETGRRRTSVFDIRNFKDWVPDDLALRTVLGREAFLKGQLATNGAFLAAATRLKKGGFGDFNGDGRIDAADLAVESERIRLVWDGDADGRADRSEVFVEGFDGITSGVAAGVMVSERDVWFACIPDLWKFPAAGKNPVRLARGEPLLTGFGVHVAYGGHDLHGLMMGPDGRVYFSIADRGTSVTTREGGRIDEPDTGAVFRCEPDGTRLELYARGLRNPQELVFDELGHLWTGDNNGDGGDKARWTLILPGADYGWRIGWQWLPKMGAWNSERLWQTAETNTSMAIVPPVAHIGHGPAGMAFYPGTGLGERFRGHFFYADFPGGVRHFRVEPDGAFFRVVNAGPWMEDNRAAERKGKLLWELSPVDVAFPPGGGVVVADWVEGWEKTGKGRLWKVTDPSLRGDALIASTAKWLRDGVPGEGEAMEALAHPDLRVRQMAQFWMARRGVEGWEVLSDAAFRGVNSYQRRHAIRALAQIARRSDSPTDLVDELGALIRLLDDPDTSVVVEACRMFGEARFSGAHDRLRQRFLHPNLRIAAAAMFADAQLFTAGTAVRSKRSASERVAEAIPGFAQRWMPVTRSSMSLVWPVNEIRDVLSGAGGADPVIRQAAVNLVVEIGKSVNQMLFPGFALLQRHPDPHVRVAILLAQRQLRLPDVAGFLDDPDPRLALEAARAVHDLEIIPGYRDLIQHLDTGMPRAAQAAFESVKTRFTREEWQTFYLRRAVNAAFRSGTATDLRVLTRAAANPELPEPVRIEAIQCLRDWPVPSGTDRVTGLTSPLPPRDGVAARGAMSDAWNGCVSMTAPEAILLAAIDAARTLRISGFESRIEALAGHSSAAVQRAIRPVAEVMDPADMKPAGTEPADRAALLRGGDAVRGGKLFAERAEWGCQRCHKLRGEGGVVGPELTGVGKRLGREQVLESILHPNRRIAVGYETVIVTLADGETRVGMVRGEREGSLVLETADAGTVTIPPTQIRSRTSAPSAMPDGLGELMTRSELRDLIEALSR